MEFPGGNDNYLTITGSGHPFLSSSETFHTPSLGDEEFEIPPISLDPDSALTVSDVVSHFGEISDEGPPGGVPGNAVVGADDPSFASPFVSQPSQGLEHLSLGVMSQPGEGALLSATLGMELGHPMGSQFSSSSPMTIDVPLSDMNHGLLGHNQLTTIDQSELSAQLGLSLGGGTILPRPQSPDQPLSPTPSPAGSLQDEEMDDFRQSALVESPVPLSVSPAVISLSPSLADSPLPPTSSAPPTLKRGGAGGGGGGKKGKKKKDPNEPQKPVSAYALFFRDTQAAIKGQNPNATFGEVSKIVASMWDSLGEEQKQVYKRKTEAAKKEYLKALAAYKANQVSQTVMEVIETPPSPPAPAPAPAPAPVVTPTRSTRIPHHAPEQNTITNICTSNIILDLPQVTTRSRTGAYKSPASSTAPPPPPPAPTVTKIVISKQVVTSANSHVPASVVTVIPAPRTVKPSPAPAPRQPPPLQQMQTAPPPPRLQQMVHSPAPPPLQAKPRSGGGGAAPATSVTTAPPPPLQIKIVPAPVQAELTTPIMVTTGTAVAAPCSVPVSSTPAVAVEVAEPAAIVSACSPPAGGAVAETEEFTSTEMEVELTVSPGPDESGPCPEGTPNRCVRAGCTNPPVESKDWDKEYCSNECVATHCRDVFMAWCSIRSQNSTTVT